MPHLQLSAAEPFGKVNERDETQKMTASVLISLLTFALFSRCTVKLSDSSDPPGSSTATPSETTEQTDLKLLYLYKGIGENKWFDGMVFIGFVGGEETKDEMCSYLESSQCAEKYAFLCDALIGGAGGTELYTVVKNKKKYRVFIYQAEMIESGEYNVQTDNSY